MTTVDTSAEVVERLLAQIDDETNYGNLLRWCPPRVALSAAATLRALAAERDAQAERSSEAHAALKHEVLRCEAMRADRDRLAAEVARLRGHIGEAIRCIGDGCEDEADKVLRAALNGGTDNG